MKKTIGVLALALAGCGGAPATTLSPDELADPASCKSCHPVQFAQWSGSMHADAAEDPVSAP